MRRIVANHRGRFERGGRNVDEIQNVVVPDWDFALDFQHTAVTATEVDRFRMSCVFGGIDNDRPAASFVDVAERRFRHLIGRNEASGFARVNSGANYRGGDIGRDPEVEDIGNDMIGVELVRFHHVSERVGCRHEGTQANVVCAAIEQSAEYPWEDERDIHRIGVV